ncbi:hypothetical protein K280104A7_04810 [Candidatus Bariatricus faecipullorum]
MKIETRKLLEKCSAGCQMALDSMAQMQDLVEDEKLAQLIQTYQVKHEHIASEAAELLAESGNEEKEPGMMAQAMSWVTTEMKMLLNRDARQAAKILMDGCNMGIQNLSGHIRDYAGAEREGKNLAKKLIRTEEDMQKELSVFLQGTE